MSFETEFALMPAIMRLEQGDKQLTSIDLRGKGRKSGVNDAARTAAPSPLIEKFALALRYFERPQLKSLALHNHFLDPIDFPLVFDALRYAGSLDSLVLFHHDLGDDGVQLLMHALMERKKDDSPSNYQKTVPLKELYLSHCGITCKGAASISDALMKSSTAETESKLSCLHVLSLGSNQIKREGAICLATTFAYYPALHRVVLHGNKDIYAEMQDDSKRHIFYKAISPAGWQRNSPNTSHTTSTALAANPSTLSMAVLSPLILPHIQRRWQNDRVLIRPYEELRRQLKHEMYKKDSTFVDSESQLKLMPDILAYMARKGMCLKQTGLNSNFDSKTSAKAHTGGHEFCPACARIALEDVYDLLHRMPHLICLLCNVAV